MFNLILLLAGAATLTFGAWQDALFLGVLVSNSAIGIAQEVRAKRALDSLATLVAPTAAVVRDGESRRIPATEVVEGDLVLLAAGDGVVADGELQLANGLLARRVDPHRRIAPDDSQAGRDGPRARSSSKESASSWSKTVGADSYAARVTGEARAFRHPRSLSSVR